jgi:hypothetical protein
MSKPRALKPMFSLTPVEFRNSPIAGRGIFARRRFAPGAVVVPYAPKHQRVRDGSAEALAAAKTKLTLVSDDHWVLIPDTSVPGGWLANHSCNPNAAIHSSGAGHIQATRVIEPGEEVTIFYGWVTLNEPRRDPCRCGKPTCRGFINFDVTDADGGAFETETPEGVALRARLDEYFAFLKSINQAQVIDTVLSGLAWLRARAPRAYER